MKVFLFILTTIVVYTMADVAYESHPQSAADIISDSSQIRKACVAPDIYPCNFPGNFTRTIRRYYGIKLNPLNAKWAETESCQYSFDFSVEGQKYGKDLEDYRCSATAQGNENIRIKWISEFGYTKQEGTFEIRRKLKNGMPEGISKIYDDNDNLLQMQTFKNGIRNGDEKTYSTKGELTTVRNFSNNALNISEIQYNEFGDKISEVIYENGQIKNSTEYGSYRGKERLSFLVCTVAQSMGVVNSHLNCYELVDLINECWQKNESKPYLISSTTFKDGLKHGVEYFYYAPCGDDGTKRPSHAVLEESPYENGILNGTVKEFHPNGKLMSTVTYENGDAVSEKKCFSKDGNVQKTGTEKMKCD
jgi:antitoxin component YwqK of YwqJK toxin-antitoxin module